MERGFSILSIDAICASVQNGITPPMMREYRPMAAPFAERRVAEPPTHVSFGRRIVRSDGNAQKSLTAPEKRAPAECHKRGQAVWKRPGIAVLGDSALGASALESRSLGLWGLGDASVHRWRRSDATGAATAQP